jgi:hypothetical protein
MNARQRKKKENTRWRRNEEECRFAEHAERERACADANAQDSHGFSLIQILVSAAAKAAEM